MKRISQFIHAVLFFSLAFRAGGQTPHANKNEQIVFPQQAHPFVKSGDIFGTRNFIENKGQFDKDLPGEKVFFVYNNSEEIIYFTPTGLVYKLVHPEEMTEEEHEKIEHGELPAEKEPKSAVVRMNWVDAHVNPEISASDKQSHYFTYGPVEQNSYAYKKIVYKNVYDHIDIEFVLPENTKKGVKYNVVLHPGADVSALKIAYRGDVKKLYQNKGGDIVVKTKYGDIIEHAPHTYCGSDSLVSAFTLANDIVSFSVPGSAGCGGDVVIDPWITTVTSLVNNNYAYDVDFDFGGAIYIYGGNGSTTGLCKVARYNSSGSLLWTFSGILTNPTWNSGSTWSSNFKVNRGSSKTYMARNNGVPNIIRLDPSGNYDNWITPSSPTLLEVWNVDLTCAGELVIYGGAYTSGEYVSQTTASVSLISTFDPNLTGCCQDVVAHATDITGNVYVHMMGHQQLNSTISYLAPSFTNTIWRVSSGLTGFQYLANKTLYVNASAGNAVAFNALSVNMQYLYGYDGATLKAYNKSNGSIINSVSVPGLTARQQGGIAVDDCDNVYVGGNGDIRVYNFSGTNFSTLTPISLSLTSTNQYVYDIFYNKLSNSLYVSGSGFVGIYDAVNSNTCAATTVSNPCNFGQFGVTVNTTSVTCANLGSATVQAVGGLGPFTYTWLPSNTTGSTTSGLSPGNYTIIATDAGFAMTFTNLVYLAPLVPLTGTLAASSSVSCNGYSNGIASVNLSGGSPNQNYLWNGPNNTTYTTASVSNLSSGSYSLLVTDALTGCIYTKIFSISQPAPLTLNIAAGSPSACSGNSITLTPLIGGGIPNYTYKWTNGPATGIYNVTDVAGLHIYTLVATDAGTCNITRTVQLNFMPLPTLTVANADICPLEVASLTVSGANSYTWNGSLSGNTFTASPTTTTVYTIAGNGSVCSSSTNVTVTVKPLPIPAITGSVAICQGQTLTLTGSGGSTYLWTGPSNFNGAQSQVVINGASINHTGVYELTVTAANSCTAPTSFSATINPTPIISAVGSTVCQNGVMTLQGTSNISPANFNWLGPNSFNNTQQNVSISLPPVVLSGNYTLVVTDQNTCSSTAVTHVTVSAVPLAVLSSNSPVCELQTLTLQATTSYTYSSYSWSGPGTFASSNKQTSISSAGLSANGIYTLIITNGPCVAQFTHAAVVNALPVISITGIPDVCQTKTLALGASATGIINSWLWMGPNSFYTSLPSFSLVAINSSIAGTYTVTAGNLEGCYSSKTIDASVMNNPVISVSDLTVCLHAPAVFKATGAGSYAWYGPNNFFSALSTPTLAGANNSGVDYYTVVGMAPNSCTSQAVFALSTRPLPVPLINIDPGTSVCEGNTVIMTGSGGVKYQWRGPESIYYETSQVSIAMTHQAFGGSYSLTAIDNNDCRASTEISIEVKPLPTGDMAGDREGCVPLCGKYELLALPTVTASWMVDHKRITTKTFDYCFTKPQTYTLIATFYDAITTCTSAAVFNVFAYEKPLADFTPDRELIIENTEPVTFQAKEILPSGYYTWYYDHKLGAPSKGITWSTLFEEEGTYRVALIVESAYGCTDSIVKAIHVEPAFNVFVPNAFTPNQDPLNNVFKPVLRGVVNYKMQIFDRWGELIFQTTDQQQGWDGTFRGKACKVDAYVYSIDAGDGKNTQKTYTGTLTLYR